MKKLYKTKLAFAILTSILSAETAFAGAFGVPTAGTAGWGRAFAGGSVYNNDPSSAFNNPAAMAFVDGPVSQINVQFARVNMSFKGDATTASGMSTQDIAINDTLPFKKANNGGQGGFSEVFPTYFLVLPINEQWAVGFSQVVPMGMRSTWDRYGVGRDFAVDTRVETIALNGSVSYKFNDSLALGGGVTVQRTRGTVTQNVDIYHAAYERLKDILPVPIMPSTGDALIRVKVNNTAPSWFAGIVWKPTERDTIGFNYHATVKNKLEGKYNFHFGEGDESITTIEMAEQLFPGLKLYPGGAKIKSRLNTPATASIDWVHQWNERLTTGTSVLWTQWSEFKSLPLIDKASGSMIVEIPYKYRDTLMFSVGADYKLTDEWIVRGGLAYDQTPTRSTTRDLRIPDNDRTFVSLGAGYAPKSLPNFTFDMAYSHQFVKRARLKSTNVELLGGAKMDGKVKASGDVFSLAATYRF